MIPSTFVFGRSLFSPSTVAPARGLLPPAKRSSRSVFASRCCALILLLGTGAVATPSPLSAQGHGEKGTRDITAGPGKARPERQSVHRVAIVIGIDRYEHVSQLRFAVKDAKAMAGVLEASGWKVLLITSERGDTTSKGIQSAIAARVKSLPANATVTLFFSGHGFADTEKKNYLATAETQPGALASTALPLEALRRRIAQHAARTVTIVDACRNVPSRSGVRYRPFTEKSEDAAQIGDGILFATAPGSLSWEPSPGLTDLQGQRIDNGIATHFMLRGLRGEADGKRDRYVSFRELAEHLRASLEQWNRQVATTDDSRAQVPFSRWNGGAGHDVLLTKVSANPVPAGTPSTPTENEAVAAPRPAPRAAVIVTEILDGRPMRSASLETELIRVMQRQGGLQIKDLEIAASLRSQVLQFSGVANTALDPNTSLSEVAKAFRDRSCDVVIVGAVQGSTRSARGGLVEVSGPVRVKIIDLRTADVHDAVYTPRTQAIGRTSEEAFRTIAQAFSWSTPPSDLLQGVPSPAVRSLVSSAVMIARKDLVISLRIVCDDPSQRGRHLIRARGFGDLIKRFAGADAIARTAFESGIYTVQARWSGSAAAFTERLLDGVESPNVPSKLQGMELLDADIEGPRITLKVRWP